MENDWPTYVAGFATWLRAGGRAESTIRTRSWWILHLARTFPKTGPLEITADHLAQWLAYPEWSPSTRKSALASARRFYHWLTLADALPMNPAKILLPVKVPRRRARPAPDDVLSEALQRCTTVEEQLLLLLAAYGGLRRTEIATLHTENHLGDWLQITGKGGVTRLVPIHRSLAPLLTLKTTGYYFPGRFAAHRHPDWVGKHISRLLGPGYTSHQLRHWFATRSYGTSHDLRAVQELLGHADISTTQGYIGISNDHLITAVEGLPDLHPDPLERNTD